MSDDHDFGDYDPEDSWDDGDSTDVKVALLERIIDDLGSRRDDRFDGRRADARRLIEKLAGSDLDRRERRKVDGLREDLEAL
jgi:hypothetical protein